MLGMQMLFVLLCGSAAVAVLAATAVTQDSEEDLNGASKSLKRSKRGYEYIGKCWQCCGVPG